jgi:hypothetical protein
LCHFLPARKGVLSTRFKGPPGAFWRDYKAELLEHFPPPLNYTLLQQHVSDFQAVQSVGADLTSNDALPDGSIYAVVKDWKSFELFMSEYEAFTNADFFTHNTKVKGSMANKLYYCR